MASTEAPISITVKTAAGSLVTVRAESGAELDQVVALSLASLSSAVHELEAAVKPNNTAVPPNPQMAAIATSFGATDVVTHTAPFVPAAYANVTDGQRVCPHGTMTRIHGLTGKFGPYKGHFCPAKQGDMTKCTTQYIKANQPEWNSFQADQTKA
jgi:Zn-dependent alcohol dehydrogenase